MLSEIGLQIQMPEIEAVMSEDVNFSVIQLGSLTWGNAARYFSSSL
ncbi:MAG TPA: hypothetical protein VGJ66_06530 [Pyrinomonadaceae bacterium]